MNEINYPQGGPCAMTLAPDDNRDTYTNYKSSAHVPRSKGFRVKNLRRRTSWVLCCWSWVIVFSLVCVCFGIVYILIDFTHNLEIGIPFVVVGVLCLIMAVVCLAMTTPNREKRFDSSEADGLAQNQDPKES